MERAVCYRPTKANINVKAIKENVRSLQHYLKKETAIIAVVKANGYGHGDVETAQAAMEAGAIMVAVATPDEAIALREKGVKGDILVMAPVPHSFAEVAARLNITVTVADDQWLKALLEIQTQFIAPLKIHVKIDCGMGRVGLRDEKTLQAILDLIEKFNNILLDGVFTHFPCADLDCQKTTQEQYDLFNAFVKLLPTKPRLVHAANSAAALLYPEMGLDAVRFGIGMYGIAPSAYVEKNLPFKLMRPLTLESELTYVKKLPKDSGISYGATYITPEDEWIGTIPIGYADGLRRDLQGQDVLVDGERVPIVGKICMDQCMVKLPKQFPVGEKVVLIGTQGKAEISVEEWAARLETIPYEIVVSISNRVPRIHVKQQKK